MLGYEYLLTIISPYFTGTSDPAANASSLNRKADITGNTVTASLTPAPLVAGALARTLSATVISPIEMFRTRLQALPNGECLAPISHLPCHPRKAEVRADSQNLAHPPTLLQRQT